jgi:hypothetical protein
MLADARELEDAHRLPHALDAEGTEILEVEEPFDEIRRLVRHVDASGLGELFHTRGEPDRVPYGCVLHVHVVSDGPDDDFTGVQTDPDGEAQAALAPKLACVQPERFSEVEGRVARAMGVVLVGDGGAEEGHDPVAEELVDRPFEAVNAFREDLEEATEDSAPFFGVEVFGDVHGPLDVREHHGHLLALALEGRPRAEDLLDEVGRGPHVHTGRLVTGLFGGQARAARVTEARAITVVVPAGGALHPT